MKLATAWRSRPRQGEQANGDAVLVRSEQGHTLLAVIDALGHGPVAADVADKALRGLASVPLPSSVDALVEVLHRVLKGTRGAAALVALFDGRTLRCGGVGNVDLRTVGTRVPVFPTPGILGHPCRKVHSLETLLAAHDRLVFFTDGLSSRLEAHLTQGRDPEAACALLMERYGRHTDDATVLVVDVEGE
ncbi:Stage II sporulation protein E (SpoIIE) [Stigmatella aurantiaca]|uniref:Stage II sporulation protein E (SpoIIE) n=1 Tax=Stigmatella aurantiaca TaxID=41 RepID=A0A1H7FBM3_STIAU|nr:SpoIIE family protein phosphatase [Stigmatella aurantiaca]SEK23496.1 Stage II sporulation protein E (SpoIIE) [Stigmatella aurantiaca]